MTANHRRSCLYRGLRPTDTIRATSSALWLVLEAWACTRSLVAPVAKARLLIAKKGGLGETSYQACRAQRDAESSAMLYTSLSQHHIVRHAGRMKSKARLRHVEKASESGGISLSLLHHSRLFLRIAVKTQDGRTSLNTKQLAASNLRPHRLHPRLRTSRSR